MDFDCNDAKSKGDAYLTSVISFTKTRFIDTKFYTKNKDIHLRKLTENTHNIVNYTCFALILDKFTPDRILFAQVWDEDDEMKSIKCTLFPLTWQCQAGTAYIWIFGFDDFNDDDIVQ